jgi:hypothetical protein
MINPRLSKKLADHTCVGSETCEKCGQDMAVLRMDGGISLEGPVKLRFIVVLNDDDGVPTLATRNAWTDRADAQRYADACAQGRKPMVVICPRGVEFREVK